MSEIYDITIIGGGPVGLFAAFYGHMRQVKVKLIDSLPQLGGQPAILYPEKRILDVPGFTNLTVEELSQRLIDQLETFETDICLNETVLDIRKNENHFLIETNKDQHFSRAVIIAMGGGAFKPRPLEVDGAEEFENVHYHVSNIQQYAGKQVAILGGGDSAVDWALAFEKIAPTTLVHRRDNFRALEHSVEELKASSVSIQTPYVPSRLIGENGHASHLEISKVKSETSREGIYACGDCCFYEGKIDLIATGLGEAPTAVNNAINYIYPDKKVQPVHSTSL